MSIRSAHRRSAPTASTCLSAPRTACAALSKLTAFSSVGELASAAAAIVEGEVVKIAEGRLVGDGEAAIRLAEVHLLVAETLKGTPSAGSTILVEELGWTIDGRPLLPETLRNSQVGDAGLYFLWLKQDETPTPAYRLINSQGRYLVEGARLGDADDSLARSLSELSLSDLEALVSAALLKAAAD